MIPELLGYVTRREGKKFLKLQPGQDGAVSAPKASPALYVHIPFCRSLCPFCCFNRYLFREDQARRYFASLRKELDLYVQRGFSFSGVYFGGGTPTVLMDELLDFMGYLNTRFPVREVSLETTPLDLSPHNIPLLKQAGVKRLSVGVQSFNRETLRAMGRPQMEAAELKDRLRMAQGQFDTLNIDLVFNFPRQSLADFQSDIQAFKDLGIDQVTFYPLMPSPHKKDALEHRFNRVDISREKSFYNLILEQVADAGYRASTAWCFSSGDRMIDEYIIDFDDYVGIGAGSVSIVQDAFRVNSFALDRYGGLVDRGRLPVIGWRWLSEKERLRYYLLTKLFGMKLDTAKFRERFKTDLAQKLRLEIAFLRASGVVQGDTELRVTRKGMYPVSVMMREFFASLNTLRERCIEKQV